MLHVHDSHLAWGRCLGVLNLTWPCLVVFVFFARHHLGVGLLRLLLAVLGLVLEKVVACCGYGCGVHDHVHWYM